MQVYLHRSVRDTVDDHDSKLLGQIARQCVTHLDRRSQLLRPLRQHRRQILARMVELVPSSEPNPAYQGTQPLTRDYNLGIGP